MEANTPTPSLNHSLSRTNPSSSGDFEIGATVIYPLHGKCSITAIETRQIQGEGIRFYRLEVQKSPLSRSNRREPEIWLPVANARERGLRNPMTIEDANQAMSVLASREYYFSAQETWAATLPKLEACIRNEGSIGLAKVASYVHVMIKRVYVPSSELLRYQENLLKFLLRELSEAMNEPIKSLEERITKSMRHKLIPDT